MSTLNTLPARNDLPWYRFKITLGTVIYTLRFRYNTRNQRWILDVMDASGNDIVIGLPVIIGRDLAGQYVMSGIPVGAFFSTDDSKNNSQPTRFSFGTDHTLWFIDDG